MTDEPARFPVHPARLPEPELLRDCEVLRTRRSGPGGQHRNKVETAIVITYVPTGTRAEANERRRQADNRRVAIRRLRLNLALEVRSPFDGDDPSPLWSDRCHSGKIAINVDHADYPSLLSEALDALAAHDWNVSQTSESLHCTSSQLVNLLRKEPRALAAVNKIRRTRELGPLR